MALRPLWRCILHIEHYEGGSNLYEYGRPAFRWDGGIEDLISASVHKLVKQVRE